MVLCTELAYRSAFSLVLTHPAKTTTGHGLRSPPMKYLWVLASLAIRVDLDTSSEECVCGVLKFTFNSRAQKLCSEYEAGRNETQEQGILDRRNATLVVPKLGRP